MIFRLIGLGAICILTLLFTSEQAATTRAQQPSSSEYVVVQFGGGAGKATAQANAEDGASLAQRGFVTVAVPAGRTRESFIAELRAQAGLLSVVADASVFAAYVPDDPLYTTFQQSYLSTIGANAAWDLATGNGGIVVAVLDTGIDTTHSEFQGRLWENTADAPNDGIDNDGNGCIDDRYGCRFINTTPERISACGYSAGPPRGEIKDDHGKAGSAQHSHGTLVSGVLGAAGDNGKGVAGMAWNVRIMTVKVLDCGLPSHGGSPGGDMSNIAEGIDYARRMGANVINLSLASRPGDASADLPSLRAAIQAAQDAGIIIVAAAGNHTASGTIVSPGYPAAYTQFPAVVGVGAANNLAGNTWETYSNYGPGVDFAAPGRDIAGPTRSDLGVSTYGSDRGTSFATPLVAGMFALMMSRNDRLAITDYIQIATATVTAPVEASHGGNWAGAGIINAGLAVARVPMTITGAALHDWKDVPAATPIRATIDGQECAAAVTVAVGVFARYALRVRSESELAGCGAPGKIVKVTIGGLPTNMEFPWAGRNGDLAFANRDITSATPPPGGIVVQPMATGWNYLARLDPGGALPDALDYLPNPWEEVAVWRATTAAYEHFAEDVPAYANSLSGIALYETFWVRTTAGNAASLNPNPAAREINLVRGWNGFVYTGASKSVADALSTLGTKYTMVMQYDNTARKWLTYLPGQARYLNNFGGLLKLRVYWIFVTEPVSLAMD